MARTGLATRRLRPLVEKANCSGISVRFASASDILRSGVPTHADGGRILFPVRAGIPTNESCRERTVTTRFLKDSSSYSRDVHLWSQFRGASSGFHCAPLVGRVSSRGYAVSSVLHSSASSTAGQRRLQEPIDKILIANRGEIACRVIQTAKRMGVKTVAVFSDADRHSKHVKSADEAVHIGPASATLSYLSGPTILAAARATNAHAIHPGYGFLSENVEFAELCKREGIEFIGPPSAAIHAMGDKSVSKKLMSEAGVPVVPGYHGDDQSMELLLSEANRIGYPVLIKATQGGGGKGMRIVNDESEFVESLSSAQRESLAAFGDSRVLIEKYLLSPRHIEVQIFGDKHGNVVHLFERDCSVQRRHQKILEEAPAPGMTEGFRQQIGQAAVDAAKAVGYESAGTVEFIVDTLSGDFYFMEMNTRLQVEHPITEMVTGQDLVEWQIRVANGEPIPLQQSQIQLSGHAFEARIYAENVPRGFLPAAGTLHHYIPPAVSSTVRVETGVGEGDSVSVYYDPMIAKLVAWGPDRSAALVKLHTCLSKFQIAGLPTNITFLKTLVKHPAFIAGEVGTHFIDQYRSDLFPTTCSDENESNRPDRTLLKETRDAKHAAAVTAVAFLTSRLGVKELQKGRVGGEGSCSWNTSSGFRLNHLYSRSMVMEWKSDTRENTSVPIKLCATYHRDSQFTVEVEAEEPLRLTITGERVGYGSRDVHLTIDGLSTTVSLAHYFQDGMNSVHLWQADQHYHFTIPWRAFESEESQDDLNSDPANQEQSYRTAAIGAVTSPMAGRVVKVFTEDGAHVKKGEPLLVLEAMKMEHIVRAPVEGIVDQSNVVVGQQVNDNTVLFQIKVRKLKVEEDHDIE